MTGAEQPIPIGGETAARPPGSRDVNVGRLVLGSLIVLVGLGWLLDAQDLVDVPWDALLPAALILIGLGLLAGSRSEGNGGLVVAGVVISILLTLGASIGTPVGGVGDRLERPTAISSVPDEYELGVGELTVDLRMLSLPKGTTRAAARVGIGQLVVMVPADVAVRIEGRAGLGDVTIFRSGEAGLDIDEVYTSPGYDRAPFRLDLDLEVGVGDIEVRAA